MIEAVLHESAAAVVPEVRVKVAWLGPGFDALYDAVEADVALVESAADAARGEVDVVHVARPDIDLATLRRAAPDTAIILDLSFEDRPAWGRREVRRAQGADRILVGSEVALRALERQNPKLAARAGVVPPPLDLERHAPLRQLAKVDNFDSRIKRFRRVHRLQEPTVLFVGPYESSGRLHSTIELVFALRELHPDLRLAAIPHGHVDQRYLDRCERSALGLGHHGVIEWDVVATDIPIWYALATVVFAPDERGAAAGPANLAAAAGRPFLGTAGGSADEVVVNGSTGHLEREEDFERLHELLAHLIGEPEQAAQLGANAREHAERRLGTVRAARMQEVWTDVTRRSPNRVRGSGADRR